MTPVVDFQIPCETERTGVHDSGSYWKVYIKSPGMGRCIAHVHRSPRNGVPLREQPGRQDVAPMLQPSFSWFTLSSILMVPYFTLAYEWNTMEYMASNRFDIGCYEYPHHPKYISSYLRGCASAPGPGRLDHSIPFAPTAPVDRMAPGSSSKPQKQTTHVK